MIRIPLLLTFALFTSACSSLVESRLVAGEIDEMPATTTSVRGAASAALAPVLATRRAQEEPQKQQKTADEIAAELSNPTSALGSMSFNFDYRTFDGDLAGASDQDSASVLFQPVLPFPQAGGYNLIFRPAIPILARQPVFDAGAGAFDDEEWNIGDISFDLVLGTTTAGGILWSVGAQGAFPTASDDDVGVDAWSLGPEVLLGLKKAWGLVGLLVGHQWDYAGDDDVNLTSGQYFYALGLGGGWQLFSGPSFSYNHNATGDQALTLPIGIGLARTLVLGGRPWKLALQYWDFVESPDAFGPEQQVRLTITPVVTLPWSD